MVGSQKGRWKFPKSDDFQEIQEVQFLSGRILAGSLVPEPKSSLKCSLGALVSGTNQPQIFEKIFHFFQLSFEEAFGSSSLTTIVAAAYGESFREACAPGTKGRRA